MMEDDSANDEFDARGVDEELAVASCSLATAYSADPIMSDRVQELLQRDCQKYEPHYPKPKAFMFLDIRIHVALIKTSNLAEEKEFQNSYRYWHNIPGLPLP